MNKHVLNIFDNSDCVSQEAIEAYVKNTLTAEQKHQVEQHLVDCEFCADAIEGFMIAESQNVNTAGILEEINQNIDKVISKKKSFNFYYLYGAAATIALVFGITYLFDITKKETSTILSENIVKYDNTAQESTVAADSIHINSNLTEDNSGLKTQKPDLTGKDKAKEIAKLPVNNDYRGFLFEKDREEVTTVNNEIFANGKAENINNITTGTTTNAPSGGLLLLDNKISISEDKPKSTDELNKYTEKKDAGFKEESDDASVSSTFSDKVTATKQVAVTGTNKSNKKLTKSKSQTESLSADFEKNNTKADTVLVSPSTYLDIAFEKYNNQEYKEAIDVLEESMKFYPNDMNTIYYSALSHFYLKKYSQAITLFNKVIADENTTNKESAMWFKSLSLIETGKVADAKQVLNDIVLLNGTYKVQAEQKLKTL